MQLNDIEKDIETAIANDEIYAATVPVPPLTATWLEFREYEVFACRLDFPDIGLSTTTILLAKEIYM